MSQVCLSVSFSVCLSVCLHLSHILSLFVCAAGDLDTKNSHIILKLLLDLNRKEGITCIMVTHDQGLKNYAHRVIHMMDGKVWRVEPIPEQTRKEMDEALIRRTQELVRSALWLCWLLSVSVSVSLLLSVYLNVCECRSTPLTP